MANTKSAAKRARQTITKTKQNRRVINAVKSSLKSARTAIAGTDKAAAVEAVSNLSSVADKAAKTGRIHINKANRLKSRAAKALKALAA